MTGLHIPDWQPHECIPTQDAYDAAVRALGKHRERANNAEAALADLTARAAAVAEEYEREPRLITTGAAAEMLREWIGVNR